MRSYVKVYYKAGSAPNFLDQFYGSLGEVPDQSPDAVLAVDRLKKAQLIANLNAVSYSWVTFWGNAADPADIIPQWFYDNGGSAFQTNSILRISLAPWNIGTWFPFTDYSAHPKN